jgi:transcription termination factor Rho
MAAEAGVPRYRLLRRELLVSVLSGGEAVPPAPPAPPPAPRAQPSRGLETARPAQRAERPARRRERPDPDEVTLEDLERPVGGSRDSFDEFPVQRPSRPLDVGDSLAARMVQIVAPLGLGQRALIAGPSGCGATTLLQEVGRGLLREGVRVHAVLVDVRPEEVPEWDGRVEVVAADSGTSPRDQVALAERALEEAKRAAGRGEDAVLLLDSLSRLARAYGLALSARPEAVEAAKRWFAAARDGGPGRGSLTLIATARVETDSSFEALVHDALEDSANMIVRLNADLAARGKYPAIDADRSRTLGEDALLGEEQRRTLENMRGVARSLDPIEAWDFLAERAREAS